VKGQSRSPVVRHNVCGRDTYLVEKRVKVADVVEKPIFNVGFPRLTEPDEVRRNAVPYRRN
jgi:hypothetical protein